MIHFPKPYADVVARLRVPSGFLIVAVFAWFSHPDALSLAIGLPISLLGLALRAWAAGSLAKNQRLATGGPYAYTRNPLYIGTLVVAAGLSTAARSPGLAALFAAVFAFVYLPASRTNSSPFAICSPITSTTPPRFPSSGPDPLRFPKKSRVLSASLF